MKTGRFDPILKARVRDSYRLGRRIYPSSKPGVFYDLRDNCWYVFGCAAITSRHLTLQWAMCEAMLRYEAIFDTQGLMK